MHSKTERIAKEAQFWVLMAQGSTSIAACNAVGVDRRTGRRWRQATGGLIPRKKPELSGRYLSLDERLRIADLHLAGGSARSIGLQLNRSASTISRELRRNGTERGRRGCGTYAPHAAQKKAELRGCRPKGSKFDDVELADLVQAKLCVKWSPRQISDHLTAMFPDRAEMRVCPETIYQALYARGRGYLSSDLHQHLRTGRGVRRPRRSAGNRPGKIPDMVLIRERPVEVDDRAVPGHWEGDLVLGSNCRSAIATLVERQSRYTVLVHLPHDHGAIAVREGLVKAINALPERLRKSLTWDQGTELAQHRRITLATKMGIYFCDPHSPWQRGTNENTNGLLRQYFPKGTDLSVHSPKRLLEVATELNDRPRRILGGRTPAQAMEQLLSEAEKPSGATTD
ncbi:Transposase and inactivated derivatives, IS30 family [Arthrobacter alpinus]|uniref:Transposase and inactivated derivatives, IS30 family n=2 Tax=Arthrobacter alpinus TaxID=656366 RepID=A0A1H5PCG3_9MICC|nr:IS30 family transposase [Arthrobacter alpinus]SEF10748.1 Transposase and inactivated derivatives, IS30 family [Arthrobacter alpinus]